MRRRSNAAERSAGRARWPLEPVDWASTARHLNSDEVLLEYLVATRPRGVWSPYLRHRGGARSRTPSAGAGRTWWTSPGADGSHSGSRRPTTLASPLRGSTVPDRSGGRAGYSRASAGWSSLPHADLHFFRLRHCWTRSRRPFLWSALRFVCPIARAVAARPARGRGRGRGRLLVLAREFRPLPSWDEATADPSGVGRKHDLARAAAPSEGPLSGAPGHDSRGASRDLRRAEQAEPAVLLRGAPAGEATRTGGSRCTRSSGSFA